MDDRLGAILDRYHGTPDEVIPILQAVQAEYGYLPEQEMLDVARFASVSEGKVYGIATFYAQFRFTPVGRKHVMVCRGTACHVRGAQRIAEEMSTRLGIRVGETTHDREYSLDTVACIGACSLAPCVMVNNEVEARMTPKKVAERYGQDAAS